MTTDIDSRDKYRHFLAIPTRWMDNDIYGHVNNVVYYSYFDTVINEYLIAEGGFDIHKAAIIGVAVETMCKFRKSLAFPHIVDAGLRVGKLGTRAFVTRSDCLPPAMWKSPRPVISSTSSSSGRR